MNLSEFNSLIGQDSYVRCYDKKRIDTAIVDLSKAREHIENGGQIGWWVKTGYIVVDIDEGKAKAIKVIKALGIKTLMAKTPKGLHLYFKTDKEFPQKIGMVTPFGLKCDFRCANKGYVILPFGTEGRAFNRRNVIAEMPPEVTPIPNRKDSLLNLKEGDGRNATLFAHLMAYKRRGATDDQIETMANIINDIIFKEGMEENELDKIVENTYKYEVPEGGDNPYLIYNAKGQPSTVNYRAIVDYFVGSGGIFVLGGECYQYVEGIYRESSSYVRSSIREMIAVDSLITQARIMEAYRMLIDDPRIQKSAADLNTHKNLINFKSGIWNIEKQRMIEHDSKYLQTLQIPHEVNRYTPFKETRLYDFLSKCRLSEDDTEMLLNYMAYCLTLDHGLKTFMVLVGKSNTGKSVLIRFFENLVGKVNTASLSMHELNMRFYPSQLYNRLLNSCADNSSLPLASIENLKKITGGDHVMHEKKGKEPFFFVPFCKLIFSFNQLPLQLEEKSNAFYKRMRILYMNKELFLNNEYVDDLCSDESVEEIIPYLLRLLPLKAIPRTTTSNRLVEALRQDSDSIHAFMTRRCKKNKEAYTDKRVLYEEYAKFCIGTGREAHKKHGFMRNLRSLGFVETRHPETREACWKGIRLKKNREEE